MAILGVLKSPYSSINSVDLTGGVQEITITYEAGDLNTTASNTAGAESHAPGLTKWSVDLTYLQDYAAGAVDATLFPLVGAAPFPVEFRPANAAASPTNPKYTGSAILTSYPPISGKVGDLSVAKIKLIGSGVLTRATS